MDYTYRFRLKAPALRRLMKERGIATQSELARRMKVTEATVSDMLHGKRSAGATFIGKATRVLGADISELFELKRTQKSADEEKEPA